jgi:hypothetical protein
MFKAFIRLLKELVEDIRRDLYKRDYYIKTNTPRVLGTKLKRRL